MIEPNDLSKTDHLAIERTKLANERTFLAYFRSFIVILSSGFVMLKLEVLRNLYLLGIAFIFIALGLLVIGIIRFLYVRRRIRKYYSN